MCHESPGASKDLVKCFCCFFTSPKKEDFLGGFWGLVFLGGEVFLFGEKRKDQE